MFNEMRRKDRELGKDMVLEILANGNHGVLSLNGPDGYPYGVPLSYTYKDNAFYFHCATKGTKLDLIEKSNKAEFCVVADVETIPQKFTTKYKSIMAFGTITELFDEEKEEHLVDLLYKYSPDFIQEGKKYIGVAKNNTRVLKLSVEKMTGKGIL
ncbi:MAG: pyridoxamine 5'-phosphate oxidase family protein [Sarcina sp.]